MSVRVVTLGEFRVLVDGEEHAALLGQRVRCAMLVYLATEQSVTRDHLMEILWPDRPPEKARHSLSQTVYALKKDLGAAWLEVRGDTLHATDALSTDTAEFRHSIEVGDDERALRQYGGGFLDGANLTTSRSFEGWVDRVRSRLAREHRNAAARVVRAREAQGDTAGALVVARAWVDRDRLDDEAQHVLIDLLDRVGRRTDALRQYDRYAALLERELEVEPLEHTRDLVERIRADAGPRDGADVAALPSGTPGGPRVDSTGVGSGPAGAGATATSDRSEPSTPHRAGPPPPPAPSESAAPQTALDALIQFADELSRRRVNRVAIAYLVVALATLEGSDLLLTPLGVPQWFQTALSVVVLLGFPVVLAVAWVFDITPRGFEVTPPAAGSGAAAASKLAKRGLAAVVIASVLGIVGLWAYRQTVEGPVLDMNRVMVFPLVTPETDVVQASVGEDVATMIGHALDRTGPLRWIDGWQLLQPVERSDIRQLTNAEARSLATVRECAFFILGRVVQLGTSDSTQVFLDLWDAAGDSTLASSNAAGTSDQTWQTGLRAVNDLLPTIVGGAVPSTFDQDLSERDPAAVVSFLLGERAFRRARGEPALLHFQAAVAEDTLFALAAIRGAQAAAWEHDYGAMESLSHRALSLPLLPSERHTAIGMVAYSEGRADSALAAFDRALVADSSNTLAWAQKGEVLSHLAPRTARPDSVAWHAFQQARAIDSRGINTSFHLVVDALSTGDLATADTLIEQLLEADPHEDIGLEIELMERCVRRTLTPEQWIERGGSTLYVGLEAAKQFVRGGHGVSCAESAFRAVLLSDVGVSEYDKEAALLGLQGILLNTGRAREALALLDAATRSLSDVEALVADRSLADDHPDAAAPSEGWFHIVDDTDASENPLDGRAYRLTLLQAAAGVRLGDRPERVRRLQAQRYGPDLTLRDPTGGAFYRMGLYELSVGNLAVAEELATEMERRWSSPAPGRYNAMSRALWAHHALAAGDTTLALERFAALRTEGSITQITWGPSAPLPFERIVEARLHLASGGTDGARNALDLASSLDGEPLGYAPYLAESLAIRIEAAEALGQPALAERLRRRLETLRGSSAVGGT